MTIEGMYTALPIEETASLPATISEAPGLESEPTLDDMLRSALPAEGKLLESGDSPPERDFMREAFLADLWVSDRAGAVAREWTIFRPHHEAILSFDSGLVSDLDSTAIGAKDLGSSPMSFTNWNEWPGYDDQYVQEVSNWYGFDATGYDDLSDRLEEWGRQISDWISSLWPGGGDPDIVVTAPSGMDIGNDNTVIFHQDGSGLISLFHNGQFQHGLQPTTVNHAEVIVTIAPTNYQIGIDTPRGGAEGQMSGGSTMTYYFRRGP